MSREIRRVPPDWKHPKDEKGRYKPLFDRTYPEALKSHFANELPWYLWPPTELRHIGEWLTGFPSADFCRPRWKKGEATHYQIYEDVSEGTPVSPVFANLDDMKAWLLEQGHSDKATSKFVKDGWAPSMIFVVGKGCSGIGIHSLDWL